MSERPIDHGWEMLVEVTNANPAQERGALNRALALIREATSELDVQGEELALMISHQADLYREVFPTMPLTCSALAKWWGKLEAEATRLREHEQAKASELEEKRKTRGVNQAVRRGCVTCGDDGWVVVSHRKPQVTNWMDEKKIQLPNHPNDRGHEETAPCPACNLEPPVMRSFWDGRSWSYSTEPGELIV